MDTEDLYVVHTGRQEKKTGQKIKTIINYGTEYYTIFNSLPFSASNKTLRRTW